MNIIVWGQIAQARGRLTMAFLALAGALLAGLGQLATEDIEIEKCECLNWLAPGAAVASLTSIGFGAAQLLLGFGATIEQLMAENARVALEGKSRKAVGAVDETFHEQLERNNSRMTWLWGLQVAAWVVGAVFYGALLVFLLV